MGSHAPEAERVNVAQEPRGFPASAGSQDAAEPGAARLGGGLVVLAVEDEPEVRVLAAALLRSLGHTVEVAASAEEALVRLAERRYDLLFTDLVLPGGLDGHQLAQRALSHQPELAVLYTSGYSYEVLGRGAQLPPGVSLLPKPYRRADLERALAQALAARAGGSGAAPEGGSLEGPPEAP